jgi:hypothetical protein
VRRERGDKREHRDDGHGGEQRAVAARDTDAEVEVPRQKERDDEQCDRDAVAHEVGAAGHVSDPGRPGDDGRGGGRHRDGLGRVVTLVAHVTISFLE